MPIFRLVRCVVFPTGSEAEVLAEHRKTEDIFGTAKAKLFESWGCGDIVEKVYGAELVSPTDVRQAGLFSRLHRLFQEGRFKFPPLAGRDPATGTGGLLKSELLGAEYDAERGGRDGDAKVKFCTQRGHDDTVYSVAWATEAADAPPSQCWLV